MVLLGELDRAKYDQARSEWGHTRAVSKKDECCGRTTIMRRAWALAAAVAALLLSFHFRDSSTPDPAPVECSEGATRATIRVLENEPGREIWAWPLDVFRRGVRPLQQALESIESGDDVYSLSEENACRLLDQAQVVLVGDDHASDLCRVAVQRLLRTMRDRRGPNCPIVLVLEAIPNRGEEYLIRTEADVQALMSSISDYWPYPVNAYSNLLECCMQERVIVLGGGVDEVRVPLPRTTPDAKRRPAGVAESSDNLVERFLDSNEVAAGAVASWLRESAKSGGLAIVLYGAAHLAGGAIQLKERIEPLGYRTLVLVPFLRAWEYALRRRFGHEVNNRWYRFELGIYRPSFVKDFDVLEDARGSHTNASKLK